MVRIASTHTHTYIHKQQQPARPASAYKCYPKPTSLLTCRPLFFPLILYICVYVGWLVKSNRTWHNAIMVCGR